MAYAVCQFDATNERHEMLSGVSVEVRRESNGMLVPVYADRDGTVPLGNPYLCTDGRVAFFAAGGAYKITLTQGTYSRALRYQAIGLAAETDLQLTRPAGAWSALATYDIGDLVYYSGKMFVGRTPDNLSHTPDSTTPGDTADWMYAGVAIAGPSGVIGVWRGPWATGTVYALKDAVQQDGSSYICVTAHTSGAFATDLAAGKWELSARRGDTGAGVPAGGTTKQVLTKASATDYAAQWSAPADAGMLTSFAINLYQDSGRMAGDGAAGIAIGSFAFPGYLTPYNGASVASLGKYINNNNDYGGTGGALNANVKDLIDKIRTATLRRYGNEFWVAQLTAGTGIADPVNSGSTYYRCLYSRQQIRAPAMTFHVYIRALDDTIMWRTQPGQAVRKAGVVVSNGSAAAYTLITPAEGWVAMTVQDQVDPYNSPGYTPEVMLLLAKAAGHRLLIACPALMGGITAIDDNVGLIAGANSWPAV